MTGHYHYGFSKPAAGIEPKLWENGVITRLFCCTATVAVFLAASISASAHHSHSNYDQSKFVRMAGTVTDVSWVNPHVWLYLEVEVAAGESKVWVLEGGSITALARNGWARESIKPGDKISVRCHPLRDGSEGCLLGFVATSGGVETEFD